jgi:hypothetical protein
MPTVIYPRPLKILGRLWNHWQFLDVHTLQIVSHEPGDGPFWLKQLNRVVTVDGGPMHEQFLVTAVSGTSAEETTVILAATR